MQTPDNWQDRKPQRLLIYITYFTILRGGTKLKRGLRAIRPCRLPLPGCAESDHKAHPRHVFRWRHIEQGLESTTKRGGEHREIGQRCFPRHRRELLGHGCAGGSLTLLLHEIKTVSCEKGSEPDFGFGFELQKVA